jgi:hypothetical protein
MLKPCGLVVGRLFIAGKFMCVVFGEWVLGGKTCKISHRFFVKFPTFISICTQPFKQAFQMKKGFMPSFYSPILIRQLNNSNTLYFGLFKSSGG